MPQNTEPEKQVPTLRPEKQVQKLFLLIQKYTNDKFNSKVKPKKQVRGYYVFRWNKNVPRLLLCFQYKLEDANERKQ